MKKPIVCRLAGVDRCRLWECSLCEPGLGDHLEIPRRGPGMCLSPDGGAVRRDTQYDGDPARSTGSLLWEVTALGRGRMRERVSLGSEEMQGWVKQRGRKGTGRTLTAICGTVSMFQEDACLANFLAIGEPQGAWAGEGAASLVGFSPWKGQACQYVRIASRGPC